MPWITTLYPLATILSWITLVLTPGISGIREGRYKRETTAKDVQFIFNKFGKRFSAKISYYGAYPAGTSACSLDPLPSINKQSGWVNVAVSRHDDYSAMACGLCLKISIKKKEIENYYASIIDICGDCKAGEISMYKNGDNVDDAVVKAIDCPEVIGDNGFIRFRILKAEKGTFKIQVKNTKIPVIGFEIYHQEKWHCFERDADNYFISDGMETLEFPITGRVTSITGQLVGFSIEQLQYDKEVISGVQFLPFASSNKGMPGNATCFGVKKVPVTNVTHLSGNADALGNWNSTLEHLQGNDAFVNSILQKISAKNTSTLDSQGPSNRTEAMINLSKLGVQVDNNTVPEQQLTSITPDGTPARADKINSTYCKGKFDGSYVHPGECEKFLLCSRGRTFVKTCPVGLRFNPAEGLCDWPRHVNCGNRKTAYADLDEDPVPEPEKDDEVYTKRFENPKVNDDRFENNV